MATNYRFKTYVTMLPMESLWEFDSDVQKVVDQSMTVERSAIFVRHYNFIDYKKHGVDPPPDFFNMVRDPVEKVYMLKTADVQNVLIGECFRLFHGFTTGGHHGEWLNTSQITRPFLYQIWIGLKRTTKLVF